LLFIAAAAVLTLTLVAQLSPEFRLDRVRVPAGTPRRLAAFVYVGELAMLAVILNIYWQHPDARTDRTAGTTSGETDEREPANATTPDTATTPGRPTPTTTETGRTPPDGLFHCGEGPARQAPKPRRGRERG